MSTTTSRRTRSSVKGKSLDRDLAELTKTNNSEEEANGDNSSSNQDQYSNDSGDEDFVTDPSIVSALQTFEQSIASGKHYKQPPTNTELDCQKAAANYINNCKLFHINVDPSVVIALLTGWEVLQPTQRFTEGSLLPLRNILDKNETIKKVNFANVGMQDSRFRNAGNGNSNARIMHFILQHNDWIKELDLSNNGLGDDGIKEICEGLKDNKSITRLNLSSNHFGEEGAKALSEALTKNSSIEELDISRNALGFQSINSLLCVCRPRNLSVITHGNYVFEEILNSVTHGIGFLGSVVGANILISDTLDKYSQRTDYHFWACVLYSFALMFLFLSSCLFHSFFMLPTTSRILQILDHVGIYMVIAGTYTPFTLIALHHSTSARVLLVLEWIAAVLGATFAACSDLNAPSTTKVELTIFVCMGLGVMLIWPVLINELCHEALIMLFTGGALYIIGIVFFILGEYKPIYHTIWHVFVLAAAAVHWFGIYFFVLQVSVSLDGHASMTKAAVDDLVNIMSAASNLTMSH